ncbi:tyrosine--tRNA ligase [Moheibacter lacus]|uniref:Tyrosine--tRNA ligase n=1 Tax=Moheibacter lacus TaxID=2745851 RepID=A0A838ZRW9_9FLAO|nr:tyrosine--tRNA ligase [Moheibacter lacus]MBA5628629.1 tyrosine--tRNA ligase [Moheibacter lacus]
MSGLISELQWRGLIHNIMPGTEEQLEKEMTTGYCGFDPTADSLHVGSLVPIVLLMHMQRHGHKPIALVGGATGMIGDPTGKAAERNLLDEETLDKFIKGIHSQLERFLDFDESIPNAALMVNNYDWMKDFSFIDFARNVGKHITVNYMMAKDSVKNRLNSESAVGMSFTEFTYQLIQGYDFLHLYKNHGAKLQFGGSDQWGNITTGTELIRRIAQGEGFAFTCPLTTKSDGTKFGKSEGGENVWLDKNRTSPYKFYQFWLNQSDEDSEKYIKIYTFLTKEEIEELVEKHRMEPHLRQLQKRLAEEITTLVHGKEELENAIKASEVLFGKSTAEDLKTLNAATFLSVFEGVPQAKVSKSDLENGVNIVEVLTDQTGFLSSKSEARRDLKANAISVNKEKVGEEYQLKLSDLISDQYILLQKGKKNYFIIIAE